MEEMEIQMEKEKKKKRKEPPVSRRDFNRIAATFGVTSTLLAFRGLSKAGERPTATQLAQAAKETEKARTKTPAKFVLRYGAAGHDIETTWVAKVGTIDFTYELEERTDGAIRVEHLGAGAICGEMTCAEKCAQGVIDLYVASTQNSSTVFPYLLILDWGALWPCRAAEYSFIYDHRREDLFQEPMRRLYGIEMLFGDMGLRGFFMSKKKYGPGTPPIDTLEKLRATGAKIRTTGTFFGLLSMKLMGVNPVTIAYEEVVDAVRQGAIDGAEAWEIPFTMIHFTHYTGQFLYLKYCCGSWFTGMRVKSLEKLPTELQEQVMEAAYLTQVGIQGKEEASIVMRAGADVEEPPPGSEHWKCGIRNIIWSEEEMAKLEKLISPKYNPDPWKEHIEKMSKLYGRGNIFEKMWEIAHEVPANAYAIDVQPHRWWKPNPPWFTSKDAPWRRGTGYFVKSLKKVEG
jgi:TRAP-type C4-dicarboxylate transport system substrate-binding protein